jgi:hypothetical protein
MANVVSLRRSARLHTPAADIVDEVVAKGIAPHFDGVGPRRWRRPAARHRIALPLCTANIADG